MKPPFFEYEMWQCGDEVCDCHMPKVNHVTPHSRLGRPYVYRNDLWNGTFHSEPDVAELAQQYDELCFACLMGIVTNHGWNR